MYLLFQGPVSWFQVTSVITRKGNVKKLGNIFWMTNSRRCSCFFQALHEFILEIFPAFEIASADLRFRALRKMVENSRLIPDLKQKNYYDRKEKRKCCDCRHGAFQRCNQIARFLDKAKEKQFNLPFFRPQALVQSSCNAHWHLCPSWMETRLPLWLVSCSQTLDQWCW